MIAENEIIQSLKNLDLTTYPYVEVKNILRQIGKVGYVINVLHPGYELMRVRPNISVNEHFSSIIDLRYKPQHLNQTYQRCSTPNRTMFYASSCQIDIPFSEPTIGQQTALLEVMSEIRDLDSELKEGKKVTFSRWRVIEDLNLNLICFNSNFNENFPDHKFVLNDFLDFLRKYPQKKERQT